MTLAGSVYDPAAMVAHNSTDYGIEGLASLYKIFLRSLALHRCKVDLSLQAEEILAILEKPLGERPTVPPQLDPEYARVYVSSCSMMNLKGEGGNASLAPIWPRMRVDRAKNIRTAPTDGTVKNAIELLRSYVFQWGMNELSEETPPLSDFRFRMASGNVW